MSDLYACLICGFANVWIPTCDESDKNEMSLYINVTVCCLRQYIPLLICRQQLIHIYLHLTLLPGILFTRISLTISASWKLPLAERPR